MKDHRLFINQFQVSVSIWVLHTWHAFMQTLHSHSECFLAHRMVKNDQYTVIRQAYLGLSEKNWIQRNGFLGQISHLRKHRLDGEWTIFFSWMDRIVANRLLLYNTGSVLHFNAMIPQQNTSHPHNIQPHSHSPTTALAKPGSQMAESCNLLLGEAKTFLESTKSKTTLAQGKS